MKRKKLSTLDRGTVIIITLTYDKDDDTTAAVLAHNPHSTLVITKDSELREVLGDVLVSVVATPIQLAVKELMEAS